MVLVKFVLALTAFSLIGRCTAGSSAAVAASVGASIAALTSSRRCSSPRWHDAVSAAAHETGISVDAYISTTATIAANKSHMTLENYLDVVADGCPRSSILTEEAVSSIFVWHDSSEGGKAYCEEVPTNGLKLATNHYKSADGQLCAAGLQTPESREAWRQTCREKALFMKRFASMGVNVGTHIGITVLVILLTVAVTVYPVHRKDGGRPWGSLLGRSIFVLLSLGLFCTVVFLIQSAYYCDPHFETDRTHYVVKWVATSISFGILGLIQGCLWLHCLSEFLPPRQAIVRQEDIELGNRTAASHPRRPQSKPNERAEVASAYNNLVPDEPLPAYTPYNFAREMNPSGGRATDLDSLQACFAEPLP